MSALVDLDLEFLKNVPNEGLKNLIDILVFDPDDGKKRRTESISNTKEYTNLYPNSLDMMVNEIIHELQRFGGETITNFFRGHGVPYREILTDICKKKDIRFSKNDSIATIEFELLRTIIFDSLDNYKEEKLDEAIADFGVKLGEYATLDDKKDAIREIVNNRETRLKAYHEFVSLGSYGVESVAGTLIGDSVKSGIVGAGFAATVKEGAKQVFKKGAGVLIPGVQILLGLWTAHDLITMVSGPAYRVTTPCVILISVLREEYYNSSKNH